MFGFLIRPKLVEVCNEPFKVTSLVQVSDRSDFVASHDQNLAPTFFSVELTYTALKHSLK